MEIARRLTALGVDQLICGGIQNRCKNWLANHGVSVVENQRGPAREIIQELANPLVKGMWRSARERIH